MKCAILQSKNFPAALILESEIGCRHYYFPLQAAGRDFWNLQAAGRPQAEVFRCRPAQAAKIRNLPISNVLYRLYYAYAPAVSTKSTVLNVFRDVRLAAWRRSRFTFRAMTNMGSLAFRARLLVMLICGQETQQCITDVLALRATVPPKGGCR